MEILPHLFTPYRKRLYFFIAVCAIAVLMAIEFWVLPWAFSQASPDRYDVFLKVVEHLLVAAMTSVILTALLLYFTPPESPEARTLVVKPPDRGRVIEETRRDTDMWWFSGGIGRYTRASTLPELNREANRNNKTTHVNVHILDPRERELCEAYADYRRTGWSAKNDPDPWTVRRVQVELVATIVAAAVYQTKSRLTVSVRYTSQVSVFRTDLGDRGAILTQEDTRMEALFFGRESGGYAALREQLRLEEKYCVKARLPKINVVPEELSLNALKDAIVDSDIAALDLSRDELAKVVELVRSKKHPYS